MAEPTIVDLYPAETDADGVRVFRPFLETWMGQLAQLVMEYPREAGHCLALGLVAGACIYLASDVIKHDAALKLSGGKEGGRGHKKP
jgi:hypothetical protein